MDSTYKKTINYDYGQDWISEEELRTLQELVTTLLLTNTKNRVRTKLS